MPGEAGYREELSSDGSSFEKPWQEDERKWARNQSAVTGNEMKAELKGTTRNTAGHYGVDGKVKYDCGKLKHA